MDIDNSSWKSGTDPPEDSLNQQLKIAQIKAAKAQVWAVRLAAMTLVLAIITSTTTNPVLTRGLVAVGQWLNNQLFHNIPSTTPQPGDCKLTQDREYTTQKNDTLASVSYKCFGTENYQGVICHENLEFLKKMFSRLGKAEKVNFPTPCSYIDGGWQLVIPTL